MKCRPFLDAFPYICIVTANSIARERMVQELRPRLPSSCVYVIQDSGFRNSKTVAEFVETYGANEVPAILSGAEELPAYGLLNLACVQRRDMSKVPRVLSRFPRLDASIGGYFAGELSVWTGKRGIDMSMARQGKTIFAVSIIVTVMILQVSGLDIHSPNFWAVMLCLVAARVSKSFDDVE